ncbi:hypothetical protein C8J57DRAFT_1534497 [Mycena rebaudengoi]|nr:hypothetical protein C8J57DRAFT_1534497 [Mycena rebaudengoi]
MPPRRTCRLFPNANDLRIQLLFPISASLPLTPAWFLPSLLNSRLKYSSKVFLHTGVLVHHRQAPVVTLAGLPAVEICSTLNPHLWSSIALEFGPPKASYTGIALLFGDVDAANDPTDLLELWFARAGASPLSMLAPYFLCCTQIDMRIPGMEVPQINALSGPFQ